MNSATMSRPPLVVQTLTFSVPNVKDEFSDIEEDFD